MTCWSRLACLALFAAGFTADAAAQSDAGAGKATVPSPLTAPKAPDAPALAVESNETECPSRPAQAVSDPLDAIVILQPDTLWRPRGSEVQFKVTRSNGATVDVRSARVCFGWSESLKPDKATAVSHALHAAPLVRMVSGVQTEAVFGAVVPDLEPVASPWPFRVLSGSDVAFTALSTVPVADLVVEVTLGDGRKTTVTLPVGVTSVLYALTVVALGVAALIAVAWAFASRSAVPGRGLALKMISSRDGNASLSQFQILVWTITVASCVVYVMVLSGNLINLTDGTLVLLGIAGATALLARVPSRAAPAPVANLAPPVVKEPAWADLVVASGVIDVTHVQMLLFTLISAAFVVLKVTVSYAIPEIPNSFLLLMGISNGIYVTGRQLPVVSDGVLKA